MRNGVNCKSQLADYRLLNVMAVAIKKMTEYEDDSDQTMLYNSMVPHDAEAGDRNCKIGIENRTTEQSFRKKLFHGKHMQYVTGIIMVTFSWVLLYTIFQDQILPLNGGLFALFLLAICSLISGQIVRLLKLPPLLGMLVCGIALFNLGIYRVDGVYKTIVTRLREAALAMVLLDGGLGLESDVLLKNSFTVTKLSIIPCVIEAVAVAAAANVIMNLPWLFGLSLGFVLSAVSPAVVVPTILKLKKEGYGEDKGMSTMIIAASSLDDIVSISAFGILLAILFSEGNLTSAIIRGPLELVIGIGSGVLCGFIIAVVPSRTEKYVTVKRIFMIGITGLTFVLGSPLIGFPGAGPLAAIVASFTANTYWKKKEYTNGKNPVSTAYSICWTAMEPLLFGLVGTEIDLKYLTLDVFADGMSILVLGLIARAFACYISVLGADLNIKEQIFLNLAWLPKATVQAAIGPVLLDQLRQKKIEDQLMIKYATNILTIAVLSILITAPIGAIGITFTGPFLLNKVAPGEDCAKEEKPLSNMLSNNTENDETRREDYPL